MGAAPTIPKDYELVPFVNDKTATFTKNNYYSTASVQTECSKSPSLYLRYTKILKNRYLTLEDEWFTFSNNKFTGDNLPQDVNDIVCNITVSASTTYRENYSTLRDGHPDTRSHISLLALIPSAKTNQNEDIIIPESEYTRTYSYSTRQYIFYVGGSYYTLDQIMELVNNDSKQVVCYFNDTAIVIPKDNITKASESSITMNIPTGNEHVTRVLTISVDGNDVQSADVLENYDVGYVPTTGPVTEKYRVLVKDKPPKPDPMDDAKWSRNRVVDSVDNSDAGELKDIIKIKKGTVTGHNVSELLQDLQECINNGDTPSPTPPGPEPDPDKSWIIPEQAVTFNELFGSYNKGNISNINAENFGNITSDYSVDYYYWDLNGEFIATRAIIDDRSGLYMFVDDSGYTVVSIQSLDDKYYIICNGSYTPEAESVQTISLYRGDAPEPEQKTYLVEEQSLTYEEVQGSWTYYQAPIEVTNAFGTLLNEMFDATQITSYNIPYFPWYKIHVVYNGNDVAIDPVKDYDDDDYYGISFYVDGNSQEYYLAISKTDNSVYFVFYEGNDGDTLSIYRDLDDINSYYENIFLWEVIDGHDENDGDHHTLLGTKCSDFFALLHQNAKPLPSVVMSPQMGGSTPIGHIAQIQGDAYNGGTIKVVTIDWWEAGIFNKSYQFEGYSGYFGCYDSNITNLPYDPNAGNG